jgi:hypothetical protein
MPGQEGLGEGFRKLDDLVLHLKGLVLVRRVRERRGADEAELVMYGGGNRPGAQQACEPREERGMRARG